MSSNSTLDPENFPAGSKTRDRLKGHDIGALGPSDSSDSGSDLAGLRPDLDENGLFKGADEDPSSGHANDIDTDRVVSALDAGLGGGLDQAEEARLEIRDDELSPSEHRRQRIAEAAYYRAKRRGFHPGNEEEDWLEAEKEIDT